MTDAMLTPWGEVLDREHPLPEYPRPQLRRQSYLNLNGIWEYAITKTPEKPALMQGEMNIYGTDARSACRRNSSRTAVFCCISAQ